MKQTEVKLLSKKSYDAQKTGAVMRDAFFNEPNFVFILPDPKKRHEALTWFFGTFVPSLGFEQGRVYGAEDAKGQAVWTRPDSHIGLLASARAGFFSLPFRFGFDGLSRAVALGRHVEALRKSAAPESHWYLVALGVAPAAQGQGVGGALLRPLLAQADEEGRPCYLDTFNERNLAFYSRHGFEVAQEARVENGPVFWGMVRQPKTAI